MASSYVDLALYDHDGRLTAVAEVKNKQGTSREWAAKLRRNLLAHGGHYKADFFLLVTPDRLYVWKDAGTAPTLVQPTYELDAQPIFAPYFERAGVDPTKPECKTFVHFMLRLFRTVILSPSASLRINSAKNLMPRPFVALRVTTLVCHSHAVWFSTSGRPAKSSDSGAPGSAQSARGCWTVHTGVVSLLSPVRACECQSGGSCQLQHG